MRVFKPKSFARWARKAGITDAALLIAAGEVTNGQEADGETVARQGLCNIEARDQTQIID